MKLAAVMLLVMTRRIRHKERASVLETASAMYRKGLVIASSGNVSMRCPSDKRNLMAITAAGKDYESLTLDQIVVVDFEGNPVVGDAIPSSEMLLHKAI